MNSENIYIQKYENSVSLLETNFERKLIKVNPSCGFIPY